MQKIVIGTNQNAQDVFAHLNSEAWDFYIEWAAFDVSGENPVAATPANLTLSTISFSKQIGDSGQYIPFDANPYSLETDSSVGPSVSPGIKLKIVVDQLPADHQLHVFIYERY